MIEEFVWDDNGNLCIYVLSIYKILVCLDWFDIFNVVFYENENIEDMIYCFKVVGEFLFMLGIFVLMVLLDVVGVCGLVYLDLDVLVIVECVYLVI